MTCQKVVKYCSCAEVYTGKMAQNGEEKSKFTLRFLHIPEKVSPPSIPLILPSTHKWDHESGKVIEKYVPTVYEDEEGSCMPKRPLPSDIKLEIVKDAENLLRTVQKPLAVLSICGPFRSGKSYFLSRLLGDEFPGVFQVGLPMRACTIGLWISTALLECDEYAVLLVDTQGVDSISSTERVATNLMTVTALLSSYLIYNSKRVPNRVDVEKLRICCLLSSSVLCRVTGRDISLVSKCFYPHFLWLLRDASLQMIDPSGNPLDPTEYLHTCVLNTEGCNGTQVQSKEAGKQICNFFRSLECRTLPLPSITPNVLRNIFHQQEKLSEKFSRELSGIIGYILQQVSPKRSMDARGPTFIAGSAFTDLVSSFVSVVNSDSLPDFQQGWMAQVRVRCVEIADELVAEYTELMDVSLGGNLPQEEENLLRIHKLAVEKKQSVLECRLLELDPLSLTISREETFEAFKQSLAKYDENDSVSGGALYPFIVENHSASRTQCEALWKKLVDEYSIQQKFNHAIQTSTPVDITQDVNRIEQEYIDSAIGPAKHDVLKINRAEILQLSSMLHKLPGEPRDLKVIGVAHNKVKLSWSPPLVNPEAVDMYYVQVCMDGGEWKTVKETSRTKALITDLLDLAKYSFSVVAANNVMKLKGLKICNSATTKVSGTKEFAVGLAAAAFPVVAAVNHFTHRHDRGEEVSLVAAASAIALTTALTPVTVLGFPFSGPLLAISLVDQLEKHSKSWGDLTPEDD